jgi:hypothetical protein
VNGYLKYFLYVVLALIFGFWIRAGWILLYPYKVLTVHSIKILDADNTVAAGGSLSYETCYTKHMEATANVERWLVNSYTLSVPSYHRQVPTGKGKSLNAITIPEFADPGIYRLRIRYTYEIGSFPSRRVTVEAESGEFLVTNVTKKEILREIKKAAMR